MKLNTSFLRGGAVGMTLALAALVAIPTFASRGNFSLKGPAFSPENHQAMQDAITNNDYAAWKALMEDDTNKRSPKILDSITEENFSTFAAMHEAMMSGDRTTAEQLRTDLGLPAPGRGMGGPKGDMRGGCTPEDRAAMDAALKNGDFTAWKALMDKDFPKGSPKLTMITEENFADFARVHQLMQDGQYEEAQTLREELGLPGKGMGPREEGVMNRGGMHGGRRGGGMMQQKSSESPEPEQK